jgi:hypothetical protein
VILLPNGEGHQKEAKVFPLAKAPTFDRLLAESSNRFAREITRIFVVLPEHQPHPAEGSAPVTELNSANYVDVCTRIPPRCVLYVSRGEPFHHNVRPLHQQHTPPAHALRCLTRSPICSQAVDKRWPRRRLRQLRCSRGLMRLRRRWT